MVSTGLRIVSIDRDVDHYSRAGSTVLEAPYAILGR